MRPIKFRIWDSDQNRVLPVITMYYDVDGVQWFGFQRSEAGPEPASMEYCEAYNGDPSVAVMQFTGLYDKNGREIYEGDIVEGAGGQGLIEDICTFVWLRCFSGNQKTYTNILDKKHWLHEMEGLETSEVIGNAHENKGLL